MTTAIERILAEYPDGREVSKAAGGDRPRATRTRGGGRLGKARAARRRAEHRN